MANTQVSSRSSGNTAEVKSEAGLAEWTNKIKAMQRQVDADEEAEQTRLEQEIAASRLARKRRSQGLGYASRSNLDVSKVDAEHLDSIPNDTSSISAEPDALQKPTDPPTRAISSSIDFVKRGSSSTGTPSSHPMSLAAFMGGSATGPRLKKHTPQQDAHDPTQFQNRSFDRASHPAFGTGGVALPGIAVQRDGTVKPSAIAASAKAKLAPGHSEVSRAPQADPEVYRRQLPVSRKSDVRERTTSYPTTASSTPPTSLTAQADLEVYNRQPIAPRKLDVRVRTTSVPASPPFTSSGLARQAMHSPYNSLTPHELSDEDTSASVQGANPLVSNSIPSARPKTPRLSTDGTSTSKSPYAAPPLAGPIRPQPRPSLSAPQIPPSVIPSKAFTRPIPQKELTPSLSRLQGRGFVQSMVKVSSQFESPPPILETPEKNKSVSERRASSVLDRWQTNVPPTSPSPSTTPRLGRRSVTFDLQDDAAQPPPTDLSRKPLKKSTSQPSLRQENIPPGPSPSSMSNGPEKTPPLGLGSATTLVVYKPTPAETPTFDEFGVKPSRASRAAALDFPAPSKPLSHPTKERARKPQKRVASGVPISPAKSSAYPQNTFQVSDGASVTTASSLITQTSSQQNNQTINKSTSHPATEFPLKPTQGLIEPPKANTGKAGHTSPPLGIPSKQVNLSPPTTLLPVSHSGDARRMVRHALPGLASPQVEGKLPLSKPSEEYSRTSQTTDHGQMRRALPGLAPTNDKLSALNSGKYTDYVPPLRSPLADKRDEPINAPSPARSSPNPCNRPTVMDVAEALNQSDQISAYVEVSISSVESAQPVPASPPRSLDSSLRNTEKRRSSYEKYSSIILPPLKEEPTPSPTPTGTLSRKNEDIKPQTPLDTRSIPLPKVDFDSLLKHGSRYARHESESTTISVEVMAISGTAASLLSKDRTIFYDTEFLAIVHRSKSDRNGLVSTSVWGWEGKHATLGAREQRKLQEIAQRYGAVINVVQQNSEPLQLVHILGGVLAIRHGTRTHWTPENTAMHLVRSLCGVIIMDEKDLNVKNLCSGYSYCVSILDSVYVWHGRGSTPLERKAALEYGHSLTTAVPPIELTEDSSKDDEMFSMILGDDEYANADYWKWRRISSNTNPRIWRVKADDLAADCVARVDFISSESSFHQSVYVMDCIWEFYVVVGSNARAHKQDIQLGLSVATVSPNIIN
ncbi:hypothetical protein C0991_001652 [Blastosporella zonata]|nr:hypothetical protein C0991_001652 [Blastosporella zonata]